jgi:putative spermidine/putrescine transport system permease protein
VTVSRTASPPTPFRHEALPLVIAALLLGVPITAGIGYLVVGALGGAEAGAAGSVARVVRDPVVLRSMMLSLWIAAAATLLALCLALAITLLLDGNARVERTTRTVAVLPLPVPTVAATVAVLLLFSQSGWLSRVTALYHLTASPADFPALVYDPLALGVIVAVVWKEMPFLLLVALSLQALRGKALADAARTLGASPSQVLRRVTLPLLLRGMAPSIIAVFVFVLGSLELPLVLGPSSPLALPLLIQERRQALDVSLHGDAYVIALLATALALVAALAHEWLRDDAT